MEDIAEPQCVLLIPRPIETKRLLEFGNQSGIDIALGFDGGKEVTWSEAHQGEDEEGNSK
jgi:hypothetical protein